ncbi:helix-turn-helix transcriptional regulator [Haloarchaeobius sp. DFWS5]|uniref:helix-turn-helix transcriptional regulator n=1 Tax=Haloarchaeobius sp. DFWS5 TaxID=3446114 RepID=UPI003EC00686
MDDRSAIIEEIGFLSRSTNRVRILEVIDEFDGASRDDLRTELAASRTTVTRNVEALLDRGWIRQENREYRVEPGVELVIERFRDLEETVETVQRLQPFLQWTTRETFDVDLSLLRDASLTVAEPGNPWAMVNEHVSGLRESSVDRILLPLTGLHAMEAAHQKIVNGDARAEFVVTKGVVETLFEDPDFAPLTTEMVETGRFEVYQTDEPVPFYLGVLDDTVQVGVDEEGEPRALLETTDPAVLEWASECLDSYQRGAVAVEADPVSESSE